MTLRVFIGYDSKEPIAYHVLSHSILRHASMPVSITPLVRSHLKGIYDRERSPLESTDFSITRFLVPFLSGYQGRSLYMDCDMLCKADISELFDTDSDMPVMVCPHDYAPKTERKFLDQPQTRYTMKNWSSVMLFNNPKCTVLSPEYVNDVPGLDLHQFVWGEPGFLPLEWNWLVGEYPHNEKAKLLHYTIGGPWFHQYRNCDHAEEWFDELFLAFPYTTAKTVSVGG